MENTYIQIINFVFIGLLELIILIFSIYYFVKTKRKEGILLLIGSAIMILKTPIYQLLYYSTFLSASNSMVHIYNLQIIEQIIKLTGMTFFTFGFILLILKQFKSEQ